MTSLASRIFVSCLAVLGPLGSLAPTAVAAPPPVRDEDRAGGDRLTVTVRHSGEAGADGTYELLCHPAGGGHPDAAGACDVLDRNTVWGQDPFAPVPDGSVCTMKYGGPVTAHVTGWWAGRPVDAEFGRGDGCQIERWDRFVPLLPDLRDRPGPVLPDLGDRPGSVLSDLGDRPGPVRPNLGHRPAPLLPALPGLRPRTITSSS